MLHTWLRSSQIYYFTILFSLSKYICKNPMLENTFIKHDLWIYYNFLNSLLYFYKEKISINIFKITTINSFVYKYISQFLSKTNSSKLKSLKFLMHIFFQFPFKIGTFYSNPQQYWVLLKNLYILLLKKETFLSNAALFTLELELCFMLLTISVSFGMLLPRLSQFPLHTPIRGILLLSDFSPLLSPVISTQFHSN